MPAIVVAKLHVEGALFSGMAALWRSAQQYSGIETKTFLLKLKESESDGRLSARMVTVNVLDTCAQMPV